MHHQSFTLALIETILDYLFPPVCLSQQKGEQDVEPEESPTATLIGINDKILKCTGCDALHGVFVSVNGECWHEDCWQEYCDEMNNYIAKEILNNHTMN